MKQAKFFAFTFTALAACAQNPTPTGTIDGVPIPSKVLRAYTRQNAIDHLQFQGNANPTEAQIAQDVDQFGVCGELRSYLRSTARERAVKELGIIVTPQEEAAERAQAIQRITPGALQQTQNLRDLIPPALAEVYDQHKDPDQVYASELAPHGIPQQSWQAFLRMPNAKTAEGRAKIKQQYQNAYEAYQTLPLTWTPSTTTRSALSSCRSSMQKSISV